MKWYYDMKIGTKLIASFVIVGAISAIVGYIGIRNMGDIADRADSMYAKELLGLADVQRANADLLALARAEKNLLLSSDQAERSKYLAAIENFKTDLKENMEKARALIYTDKGKELLEKFDQAWKERAEVLSQTIELASNEGAQKKRESVDLSFGLGRQKSDAVEDVLSELVSLKETNAKEAAQATSQTYQSSRSVMLILAIGGVLLGVGLGIFISRSISQPVGELALAAKNIAMGDINQRIEFRSGDELGALAEAFRALIDYIGIVAAALEKVAAGDLSVELEAKSDRDTLIKSYRRTLEAMKDISDTAEEIAHGNLTVTIRERSDQDKLMQALAAMVSGLTRIVTDVRAIAGEVSAASQAISSASIQVSNGASGQAASAEEASSSMEQMVSNIKQNADNATVNLF